MIRASNPLIVCRLVVRVVFLIPSGVLKSRNWPLFTAFTGFTNSFFDVVSARRK